MAPIACGPISGGLHIDSPPTLRGKPHAVDAGFVSLIAGLGVDHALVMVDGQGDGLDDVKWSIDQLQQFGSHCDAVGIHPMIMLWPEPSARYVARLRDWIPMALGALWERARRFAKSIAGAVGNVAGLLLPRTPHPLVSFDCEKLWATANVRGYASRNDAGQALRDAMHSMNVPYEVCTFRGRLPATQSLLLGAERPSIMIYPRRHRWHLTVNAQGETVRTKERIPYDSIRGPARMVPYEIGKVMERLPPRLQENLAIDLPDWDQRWPGVEPFDAMQAAFLGAVHAGVRTIRWWSSKFAIGHLSANAPYAAPAIRRLLGGEAWA